MLKQNTLNIFTKFLKHSSNKDYLINVSQAAHKNIRLENAKNPYFPNQNNASNKPVLFITGRFRSGSTLLWNLFRNMPQCTAFYEPFNERKWFLSTSQSGFVDKTHIGVKDYWKEYEGLEQLNRYYQDSWIDSRLWMDEKDYDHDMYRYIEEIIASSKDTMPILQFNRVDFRLTWLRKFFPNAKILHIYRHPREQWLSFLTDKKLMNAHDVLNNYKDSFYLNSWCKDLSQHFPFLSESMTPHPYARFYYLWKLSYLYGMKHSDLSISFESLVSNPEDNLKKIQKVIDFHLENINELKQIIKKPDLEKWKNYADENWFNSIESECESNLTMFLE